MLHSQLVPKDMNPEPSVSCYQYQGYKSTFILLITVNGLRISQPSLSIHGLHEVYLFPHLRDSSLSTIPTRQQDFSVFILSFSASVLYHSISIRSSSQEK
jgi:hypothetical protein